MTSARYSSGHCILWFALAIAGCVGEDGVEDLGEIGDGKSDTVLPRSIAIELDAGERKRFRITAAAFVASLTQSGDVDAELIAKHYELTYGSDVSVEPELQVTGDGTVRNWSLTVYNRGTATLDATLVVDRPQATAELGIVSDIDKTVLPPEVDGALPPPYPGIATLLRTLELRSGGAAGDVRYVTAREPDAVVDIPAWMAMHGVPEGSIDTGVSGLPWIAETEKVNDISRIMDATGTQSFVLFGDTSHRDPEVYKRVRTAYPSRVSAVFINKVNATVNPTRVEGMHLVDNYAQAAAIAFGQDLLTEAEARSVMTAAQAEGLAITDDEIDTLIDAARPD